LDKTGFEIGFGTRFRGKCGLVLKSNLDKCGSGRIDKIELEIKFWTKLVLKLDLVPDSEGNVVWF
jgi:hypothetical protein